MRLQLLEVGRMVRNRAFGRSGGGIYFAQGIVGAGLGKGQDSAQIRRGGVAPGQGRQSKSFFHGLEHRSMVEGHGLPPDSLGDPVDRSRLDIRRHQHRRHPHPEALEIKAEFPVGIVRGHRGGRGGTWS